MFCPSLGQYTVSTGQQQQPQEFEVSCCNVGGVAGVVEPSVSEPYTDFQQHQQSLVYDDVKSLIDSVDSSLSLCGQQGSSSSPSASAMPVLDPGLGSGNGSPAVWPLGNDMDEIWDYSDQYPFFFDL